MCTYCNFLNHYIQLVHISGAQIQKDISHLRVKASNKIVMQTLANHQMKTALVHFGVTEGPKQNFIVLRFKIIIKLNQPN